MHQAFEAAIDERGQVRLADNIDPPVLRHAIVIVLDEPAASVNDTASESELKYSKKQGQYLAFIHRYTRTNYLPASVGHLPFGFDS